MRPHLLTFEPDPRGHAREWIDHILDGALAHPAAPLVTVLTERRLAKTLARERAPVSGVHLRFLPLGDKMQALCTGSRLVVSGFARHAAMTHAMKRSGATHGLFLGLDHLSLPLALQFGSPERSLSGILFRPTSHYADIGPYRPTPREKLRDRRKSLLYRAMLANRALRNVFSLDPYFPGDAHRRFANGAKVVGLADPAAAPCIPKLTEEALARRAPVGRRLFVLFGELTERKGPLVLIEALRRLPASAARRTAVIIAGRVDPSIRERLVSAAGILHTSRPELWFELRDGVLTPGEIAALLNRCDVVLAPYQRFVGSSGVLLWAARKGRPVITQDYGLVGRLAREHGLGRAIDTTDPSRLSDAIAEMALSEAPIGDSHRMAAFAAQHRARNFARTLFRHILFDGAEEALSKARPALPTLAHN